MSMPLLKERIDEIAKAAKALNQVVEIFEKEPDRTKPVMERYWTYNCQCADWKSSQGMKLNKQQAVMTVFADVEYFLKLREHPATVCPPLLFVYLGH